MWHKLSWTRVLFLNRWSGETVSRSPSSAMNRCEPPHSLKEIITPLHFQGRCWCRGGRGAWKGVRCCYSQPPGGVLEGAAEDKDGDKLKWAGRQCRLEKGSWSKSEQGSRRVAEKNREKRVTSTQIIISYWCFLKKWQTGHFGGTCPHLFRREGRQCSAPLQASRAEHCFLPKILCSLVWSLAEVGAGWGRGKSTIMPHQLATIQSQVAK